jgi:hypothetical protein
MYRETYCEFCERPVYKAIDTLPDWLNRLIGHNLWRFHRHTVEHQVSRGLARELTWERGLEP